MLAGESILPRQSMEYSSRRATVTNRFSSSGPILHTTTIDGHFRIWGCMIDEPLSFSLWATIDAHAELPIHIPISTNFIRTRTMDSEKENGTMDDFLTIFSDGSARMTTVTVRFFWVLIRFWLMRT